ncbi:hypothetical protein E4U15_008282 [Claviceps sp. LM218 group G6]|nr:hypothetical protein E4U15_008282 [Claviceps sp. LM218 group G6]
MEIFNITAVTVVIFAAMATASPVDTVCASELIGSTAKCNAEIMQNGFNFAANLACLISAVASGIASSVDKCKHCIPKTIAMEPQTVEE